MAANFILRSDIKASRHCTGSASHISICREKSFDRVSDKSVVFMNAGAIMDITVAFAFLIRLLTFRSRLLLVLNTHVEDWYSAEGCSARTILRLSLQCFTSLPSPGGVSMIIFLWIVVGTIVASTFIALLCYKRSEMTLSEIAEKLEKQESSPTHGASAV